MKQRTVVATAMGVLSAGLLSISGPAMASEESKIGRDLAVSFCQACHVFEGTSQAGTTGPAFIAVKARLPDKKRLQDYVYDPQVNALEPDKPAKGHTMMPPFGRNGLLTKEEIAKIVDFLHTL